MKLIPYLSQRLSFAVFATCIFLTASSAAQDFKTVHDGVEYAEVTRQLADKEPVKINLLRLDLTKVRLDVHHALDKAIGVEKTSSIATRHGAVAAINAGFFRLDKSQFAGDSAGVLIVDGILLSESSNGRIATVISNESDYTRLGFGSIDITMSISLSARASNRLTVHGINRERKPSEAIIYDRRFGTTTLTAPEGTEIVFPKCKFANVTPLVRLPTKITCGNGRVKRSTGNNSIPERGVVLSIGPDVVERSQFLLRLNRPTHPPVSFLATAKFKSAIFLPTETYDIVAGVPQLIKDGKIDITWEQEKASKSFVEARHPRTAVAKLKDGKFLMMTVDGRQPGVSVGMNLYELADYLLSLGAVDAMNLDGGGSTTMFLDGKIVNKPSDKEGERKVGDAILVTLRNKKSPKNPKK